MCRCLLFILFISLILSNQLFGQETLSIEQVKQLPNNSLVEFKGIVTRAKGNYVFVQDTSAGIVINSTTGSVFDAVISGDLTQGDSIKVKGITQEIDDWKQIDGNGTVFQVLNRLNNLPKPIKITTDLFEYNYVSNYGFGKDVDGMLVGIGSQYIDHDIEIFKSDTVYNFENPLSNWKTPCVISNSSNSFYAGKTPPNKPDSSAFYYIYSYNYFECVVVKTSHFTSKKEYILFPINESDIGQYQFTDYEILEPKQHSHYLLRSDNSDLVTISSTKSFVNYEYRLLVSQTEPQYFLSVDTSRNVEKLNGTGKAIWNFWGSPDTLNIKMSEKELYNIMLYKGFKPGDDINLFGRAYYVDYNLGIYPSKNTINFTITLLKETVVKGSDDIAKSIEIIETYPNPFNPSVTIKFEERKKFQNEISFIKIYDILGREVFSHQILQEANTIVWQPNMMISGGLYYVVLSRNGNPVTSKKIVYLK